jgi:hypothetical protein
MADVFAISIDKLVGKKDKEVLTAENDLVDNFDNIEKKIFDAVKGKINQMNIEGGKILFDDTNTAIVNEIDAVIQNALQGSNYPTQVKQFLRSFEIIKQFNFDAQKSVNDISETELSDLIDPIQKANVEQTLNGLTGTGVSTNFIEPVREGIFKNIVAGTTISDLETYLTNYIISNPERMSGLKRYVTQVSRDSLNQFDGQVNSKIAETFGLDAFRYVGSLIDDSRPQCVRWVGKNVLLLDELQNELNWAYNNGTGMIPGTTPNNFAVFRGGYNCRHSAIPFKLTKSQRSELLNEQQQIENITPEQQKAIDSIERDKRLTGQDAILQEQSIRKVVLDEKKLVANYLKNNENVINTDEARKEFIDIGYNGTNASAVHEASSVLGKKALEQLIENGKNNTVSFYAGGAGSCKTSTIETLIPGIRKQSDAIIDGNLAQYSKAAKKIGEYLEKGKNVEVAYVYRDPLDAWDAVIKRMLNNKSEMGRAVSSSVFIENTTGSYNTAKQILNSDIINDKKFNISIFDNSLGKGNAEIMNMNKFNNIEFPPDLKKKLREITDDYLQKGLITKQQYDVLIQ